MMKIVTLYRPIGLKELQLIIESGSREFPDDLLLKAALSKFYNNEIQ